MGLKQDVTTKVEEYLSGDYEVEETTGIPAPKDVAFGNKAKKAKLCVFYIDLRKSTELLFVHQKQTAGKIHKAFLHTVAATVLDFGGVIRGFKGDSLMAMWPANYKSEVSKCVQAAMTVKWFLDVELAEKFEQYSKVDFGIGIDWGEVFITRAGIPRDSNNNDLIFMGKCINFAVAIGEQAKGPDHVEISRTVFDNLEDRAQYGKRKDFFGNEIKVSMWREGKVEWLGESHPTNVTNWYWEC
jgi:class 3 adenylate cyclase